MGSRAGVRNPATRKGSAASWLRLATVILLILAVAVQRLSAAEALPGAPVKIVLLGGKKSHGPGEHDFPNGIPVIKKCLETASNVKGITVDAYPETWPTDLTVLDGASTIVWYFDGIQQVPHPLLDEGRRKAFTALMDKGVGLVCLHQASSLPADNKVIPMTEWVGGCRYGMPDRLTTTIAFIQETPTSPVCRGWTNFSYKDEVYPTIAFTTTGKPVTPILVAVIPPEKPERHIIAWTYERPNGGRSFAFTGGHYLKGWETDEMRRMVLNAILWTAKLDVPAAGVQSTVPGGATK